MGRVDLRTLANDDVPDFTAPQRAVSTVELSIEEVAANPLNQRVETEEEPAEIEAMAQTIRAHGVLQPLVVVTASAFLATYPSAVVGAARWVALIGNRRLAAARLAGRDRVPAIVNDERIGSMHEVMLVENGHRRDLSPLREAEAMSLVLSSDGITRDDLASRIGRTKAYVTQRMHLLGLIPELKAALVSGSLTVERGRDIGRLPEAEQREIAAAGAPYRTSSAADAPPRRTRGVALPRGNPAAAARSIRELYAGKDLDELIRLLTESQ